MDKYFSLPHRDVISISGRDRLAFLQGLITKDIHRITPKNLLYSLLLSPKGRIDFDLFIFCDEDKIYMDTDQDEDLIKRLNMFKLRSDISIVKENLKVYALLNEYKLQDNMVHFYKDPRHSDIGYRFYTADMLFTELDNSIYEEKRVRLCLPDGIKDLIKGRALPLEWNMDHLNAIDFDKGCYLGQELTARTRYRELIKKRIKFLNNEDLKNVQDESIAVSYTWGGLAYIKLEENLS